MTALTDQVLFNATIATLLAPIAYASRWLGRPMLTHALWLIVLARLIVPPVWFFTVPTWTAEPPLADPLPLVIEDDAPPIADEIEVATIEAPIWIEPETPIIEPVTPAAFPWSELLLASWAMIAIAWWGRLIFHALRFQKLLQFASPADFGTQKLVEKLSRHMGLRRAPQVVMIPARLSPCVWCFSARPVLLLPQDWTGRQHQLNRAAVLVHELAHLRRGDHWVRWFELVVTGLFWWLPTVWFARKHLREAEELCCDGWVIATLPAARHAYASALIDMADYLAPLRPALPPLASGFGQVHELRRRLHMILHAKPAVKAGRSGAAIALGLGLFLLPVGLVRSQEQEQQPPTPEQRERQRAREAEDRANAAEERERAAKERARAAEARSNAEVSRRDAVHAELKAELAEAQKRLADAQKAVERIRARMNEAGIETRNDPVAAGGGGRTVTAPRSSNPFGGGEGGRGGGSGAGEGRGGGGTTGGRGASGLPPRAPGVDTPPEPPQPPRPPQPVEAPRGGPGRTATTRSSSEAVQALDKAIADLQQQKKNLLDRLGNEHPLVKDVDNQIITLEEAVRRVRVQRSSTPAPSATPPASVGPVGPGGMPAMPVPTAAPSPRVSDDRVQQLERQLEMLRKELEAMRRDMRREPGERATTERRSDNRPPDRSPQP